MQKKKWRRKKLKSAIELQKYRRGPVVDESEHTHTTDHVSGTTVSQDSLESRMRSEICSRLSEGSKNGSDDALESGEF